MSIEVQIIIELWIDNLDHIEQIWQLQALCSTDLSQQSYSQTWANN